MHAPPKPAYPVITPADLPKFDGFIFGVPTRYGNMPAQLKVCLSSRCRHRSVLILRQAFWDATGGLWAQGALAGKYAAAFVSTGTLGGGQGALFHPHIEVLLLSATQKRRSRT